MLLLLGKTINVDKEGMIVEPKTQFLYIITHLYGSLEHAMYLFNVHLTIKSVLQAFRESFYDTNNLEMGCV